MKIRMGLVMALMLIVSMVPASAAVITYNFAIGTGVNSPVWPASGGSTGLLNSISLGTATLLLQDPNSVGVINALQLVGSGGLYCVEAGSSGLCAVTATSETVVAGHAAGIGVGNGRIEGSETLTITVLPGYTAQLLSIETTALLASTSEQWQYSIDGGLPVILNASNQAIDVYNFSSLFSTLVLSVPAGGPPNTFALYSMTVDVTRDAVIPEPGSFVMLSGGLVGVALLLRRRRSQ
jgi:hypothetical protein